MSVNILVATPQPALGELLRLSLEESSKYRVRLAQSGREALAAAGRIAFDLAILDASLNDQPMPDLIRTLLAPDTGLKLIVIPPENDPSRMSLNGMRPDAYLNLPFYAPDLIELISNLLHGVPSVETQKVVQAPAGCPENFKKNPEEIKALLVSLFGQTTAQGGLVICNREVLASGGRLDKKRILEIADLINRSWDEQNSGDLARYVRLTEGGGEFMVYATALAAGAILALVYDPSAPMTRIHAQAVKTARALRALPNQDLPEQSIAPAEQLQKQPAPPPQVIEAKVLLAELAPEPASHTEELADMFSSPAPTGQEADDLLLALKNNREDRSLQAETPELPDVQEMIEPSPEAIPTSLELTRPAPETVRRVIDALEAVQVEDQPAPASVKATSETDQGESEDSDEAGEEGELPEISLSDLLAAMPPPDPGERKLEPGIEWITGDEEDGTAGDFLFPWEKEAQEKEVEKADAVPSPTAEAAVVEVSQQSPIEAAVVETSPEPAAEPATAIVSAIPAAEPEPVMALANAPEEQTAAVAAMPEPPSATALVALSQLPEPPPSEGATEKIIRPGATAPATDATRPIIFQSAAPTQRVATPFAGIPLPPAASPEPWNQVDEQDPPSGDFASLTYTCVMLPRLPDIKLSGRLVNKLAERLQQICLAYGWRLVNQVIRPDTFQWTVQVSAIVSPGSVARLVRQQTSQLLFDQFEQFDSILPSGDFWAPGYLIISGAQPPDTRLIGEYISDGPRRRQGIRL